MLATIRNNDGRIFINTRATPRIMAFLPLLEGRRAWLKGGGLSIEDTPHNREAIRNNLGLEVQDGIKPTAPALNALRPIPPFKRKPDNHQIEALEAIGDNKYFALFMEQGTGKTKVGIDWAVKLFCLGLIEAVLVISKRGVHRQWILEELDKDCSVPFLGAFWNHKPAPDNVLAKSNSHLLWYAINWDAIKTPKGMEQASAFCKAHSGRLLIIGDESHEIKNHSSRRAKAAMALRTYSSHRLIATGTPIAKDLTDEWSQLNWLDPSILACKYVTTFRAKYCIMGGFEGRAVVGQKNMDDFKSRVEPYTFRRTKEQIGILPKRYNDWLFDLTRDQKRLIRSVKQELLAELNSGVILELKDGISAFTKIQQIAGGFIIDSETKQAHRLMPIDKNPRVIAMLEWLQANEGKAIIWSAFIEDRLIITEALRGAGVTFSEYHGATSEADREASKRAFMDPSSSQVLVAGRSASTGLNLQGLCNRALYYSNTFNAIDRWQSEDRIHRIGTIGAVTFTDLIGRGSTDRHIKRNLLRKEGIARLSLGDFVSMLEEIDDSF